MTLIIKQSKHNESFIVFDLGPLENKALPKTLWHLYKINLFTLSDAFDVVYETTHGNVTDVKKR